MSFKGDECRMGMRLALAARFLCVVCFVGGVAGCGTLFSGAPDTFARYRPSTGLRPAGIEAVATNNSSSGVAVTAPAVPPDADGEARKLRSGDRITLRLSGMRVPVEVVDVLDEKGAITLELLGTVTLAGLTTTEAEDKIEKAYIDRQIYKSISVSIVVEQSWYYVRGEVNQPGRFVLTEALTLMQAVAAAGGYTDFAKPSKVKIMRGEDVLYFDAARIEKRQDKDPMIRRGDTIIVERTTI